MTSSTAHRYYLESESFKRWMNKKGIIAEDTSYNDIMKYIKKARKSGNTQNTICRKLRGVRYWFDYRYIQPNPCDRSILKSQPYNLPSPLLTPNEVIELYEVYPEWTNEMKRDKVMLGLCCFLGITGGELRRLKEEDIFLSSNIIRIKGGKWSADRSLKIHPLQYELLKQYLDETRIELLAGRQSDMFCVKKGATQRAEHLKNYISRLTANVAEVYPKFKNIPQLRSSVICNWLKNHNLRETQYMAGHKNINATERFIYGNTENLQRALDEFHPLR